MDDDTQATLNEYNEQLKKVNEALRVTENEEDRNNLISLKNDLQQLIALTSSSNEVYDEDEAKIDDEYAMFMAEMEKEGAYKGETSSGHLDKGTDLSALEGTKCKAPHCHTWGTTVYHNALITTVIPLDEHNDEQSVKVLFINPTHKEMLPCPYYLETECRFSEDKCRFSHGEIVKFDDLREYIEPDFAGLVIGSTVLAKQDDRLWHKGLVRRILKDKEKCIIKLERSKDEVEVEFVDLLPIGDDDNDNESSEDDSGDGDQMDEDAREDFINMSLLIKPSEDKLGSWEKHTKGIGSKLMEKMGYVIGTGLGRRGEGRIEPVTAVALPAGKSLDHCMELREKSGGDKNLFNVERKLKRQAKKQEARNLKNYEREKRKVDVFSFLNDTIGKESSGKDNAQVAITKHRKEIKAETSRNLSVESFKLEQREKELQAEMVKIRQAMQRQSTSQGPLYKQLRDKYNAREAELKALKEKAFNIKNEQSYRKTTRELTKF